MSKEKGVTDDGLRPFSMSDPDDIVYSPIEEAPEHDWDTGMQMCKICGLDLLDYLVYSSPCKKK